MQRIRTDILHSPHQPLNRLLSLRSLVLASAAQFSRTCAKRSLDTQRMKNTTVCTLFFNSNIIFPVQAFFFFLMLQAFVHQISPHPSPPQNADNETLGSSRKLKFNRNSSAQDEDSEQRIPGSPEKVKNEPGILICVPKNIYIIILSWFVLSSVTARHWNDVSTTIFEQFPTFTIPRFELESHCLSYIVQSSFTLIDRARFQIFSKGCLHC
jgi:hypothetical protein